MPRFYCDYCDAYLTHDSMSGRQQHMRGWKHRENFKLYYQTHFAQWMQEQQARQMQQYPHVVSQQANFFGARQGYSTEQLTDDSTLPIVLPPQQMQPHQFMPPPPMFRPPPTCAPPSL